MSNCTSQARIVIGYCEQLTPNMFRTMSHTPPQDFIKKSKLFDDVTYHTVIKDWAWTCSLLIKRHVFSQYEMFVQNHTQIKTQTTNMGRYMPVISYRNFFLFLNFIPAIISTYYIHLTFSIIWRYILVSLLRNIPALLNLHFELWLFSHL
jgi:hypothetical protein